MNRHNILKLAAAYMRSLPGDKYDQTRATHCLLKHMLDLFGVEADAADPIAAKKAAVELLGVEKGQADFLYADYPLGRRTGKPSPFDAYMVLKRLALIEDKGVAWCFHIAAWGAAKWISPMIGTRASCRFARYLTRSRVGDANAGILEAMREQGRSMDSQKNEEGRLEDS